MRLQSIALFLALGLICSFTQANEVSTAKENDIRTLLDQTGADKIGIQLGTSLLPMISQGIQMKYPQVTQSTLTKINNEISNIFIEKANAKGGLVDIIVPIYAKHYSHDEIKELIKFYKTDLGKKTIDIMPVIMTESMAAGQKWGQGLGPEISLAVQKILADDNIAPPAAAE